MKKIIQLILLLFILFQTNSVFASNETKIRFFMDRTYSTTNEVRSIEIKGSGKIKQISTIMNNNTMVEGNSIIRNLPLTINYIGGGNFNSIELILVDNYSNLSLVFRDKNNNIINTFTKYHVVTDSFNQEARNIKFSNVMYDSFTVNWSNTTHSNFSHVYHILNGTRLSGTFTNGTRTITGLNHDTEYNLKIVSVDIFGNESPGVNATIRTAKSYEEVTGVSHTKSHNTVFLNWNNPTNANFKYVKVYKDGEHIDDVAAPESSYFFSNLEPFTLYQFILTTYFDPPDIESDGVVLNIRTNLIPSVKNLSMKEKGINFISINYDEPELVNVDHYEIHVDNIKIAETNDLEYLIENLADNQNYTITVYTVDIDGNKSDGVEIFVKTDEAPKVAEIEELKAVAKPNRVDLSWKNPETPYFHFVRIYRKTINDETSLLNELLFGKRVFANGEYDPLFETNGTYFNDLTVKPETTYEYKLNTLNIENTESEGITILVTTGEESAPVMSGVNETTNENGDYVYSWTSPTDGQVKIFVGGKEFATVPASDGQIIIPAADMKYSVLNSPDVQLQPISSSGKEGVITKPGLGGVSLPFGVGELLTSSVGLMGVLGSFILLVLAVRFAPRLIALIKKSAANKQSANNRRTRS